MFGGLESLPVLVLQIAADLVLLLVAATVVLRAHRRAGLAVLFGVGLSLSSSALAPLVAAGVLVGVVKNSGPNEVDAVWWLAMAGWLFAAWSPYVARAIEAVAVTYALVALVRRLPPGSRDDLGGAPPPPLSEGR